MGSEPLQDWREACTQVLRTYKAWSAADRHDRHDRYVTFLTALRCEERAARHVAGDAQHAVSADQLVE